MSTSQLSIYPSPADAATPPQANLTRVCACAWGSSDGHVSLAEFQACMHGQLRIHQLSALQLEQLFRSMDVTGSGVISIQDLNRVLCRSRRVAVEPVKAPPLEVVVELDALRTSIRASKGLRVRPTGTGIGPINGSTTDDAAAADGVTPTTPPPTASWSLHGPPDGREQPAGTDELQIRPLCDGPSSAPVALSRPTRCAATLDRLSTPTSAHRPSPARHQHRIIGSSPRRQTGLLDRPTVSIGDGARDSTNCAATDAQQRTPSIAAATTSPGPTNGSPASPSHEPRAPREAVGVAGAMVVQLGGAQLHLQERLPQATNTVSAASPTSTASPPRGAIGTSPAGPSTRALLRAVREPHLDPGHAGCGVRMPSGRPCRGATRPLSASSACRVPSALEEPMDSHPGGAAWTCTCTAPFVARAGRRDSPTTACLPTRKCLPPTPFASRVELVGQPLQACAPHLLSTSLGRMPQTRDRIKGAPAKGDRSGAARARFRGRSMPRGSGAMCRSSSVSSVPSAQMATSTSWGVRTDLVRLAASRYRVNFGPEFVTAMEDETPSNCSSALMFMPW